MVAPDGIKAALNNADYKFLRNKLDFRSSINERTGEVSPWSYSEFRGLRICIYKNLRAELRGSLHRFKNFGHGNWDTFSPDQLRECLEELSDFLQTDLSKSQLHNLEFGLNIRMDQKMLDNTLNGLMYYHGNVFKNELVGNGEMRVVDTQRHKIKVYDKSLQYNLDSPVLRLEVHYRRMNQWGKLSITDLAIPYNQNRFMNDLVSKWDKVIFFDNSIEFGQLPIHEREVKRFQWSNPDYWKNVHPSVRSREWSQLSSIALLHSKNIKENIRNAIISKN